MHAGLAVAMIGYASCPSVRCRSYRPVCDFLALKNAKVPAELHIYANGGHGYGLRRTDLPVTAWPKLVETWLQMIHVAPAGGP